MGEVRGQAAGWAIRLALVVAVSVAVILLLVPTHGYRLNLDFTDAGQLVDGDLVKVDGHPVGSVTALTLSPSGQAEVHVVITDSSITPLGSRTLAQIGQTSLTGVANRFIDLTPGPGPGLVSGSTLGASQTTGIVDFDQVLDSLTPQVQTSLKGILRSGAYLVSGQTPADFRRLAGYLSPALGQSADLSADVDADRYALNRLVDNASAVAGSLSAHTPELTTAVAASGQALSAVADQRAALQDAITRAPAVLSQATGVLAATRRTLAQVNPALTALRPAASPLAALLRRAVPAATELRPTLADVESLVPGAESALAQVPHATAEALPAVRALTAALVPLQPILRGFRAYAPEIVGGFVEGLGGSESGYYDANGHYARVQPVLGLSKAGIQGVLSFLGGALQAGDQLNGYRTGLDAPCPGGGVAPATAGGNPWTDPDVNGANVCDPADDTPADK